VWTTYWDLFVQGGIAGDTGEQGDTGDQGNTGVQGDTGVEAVNQFSITIENPTGAEEINLGHVFADITVTEVQAVVAGTGGPSVTIDPQHRDQADIPENDILSSPTAITNTGDGQNLTSFDDPSVPADSWMIMITTAIGGATVTALTVTIKYTVD
jgi:hypothetical protein